MQSQNIENMNTIIPQSVKKRMGNYSGNSILGSAFHNIHYQFHDAKECIKNKATQTDFRENECQTIPWDPPYLVKDTAQTPEILDLKKLTWGSGLPSQNPDILAIHRSRIRKAWEKLISFMSTDKSKNRLALLTALEKEELKFREEQIVRENKIRMELTKQNIENKENEKANLHFHRLKFLEDKLSPELESKLTKIKNKSSRKLRKITNELDMKKSKYTNRNSLHVQCDTKFILPKDEKRYGYLNECLKYNPEGRKKTSIFLNAFAENRRDSSKPQKCSKILKKEKKFILNLSEKNIEPAKDSIKIKDCSLVKRKQKVLQIPQLLQNADFPSIMEIEGDIHEYFETAMLDDDPKLENIPIITEISKNIYHERKCNTSKNQELKDALSNEERIVPELLILLTEELTKLQKHRKDKILSLFQEKKYFEEDFTVFFNKKIKDNYQKEIIKEFNEILEHSITSIDEYLQELFKNGIRISAENESKNYVENLAEKLEEITKETENFPGMKINHEEELCYDSVYNMLLPHVIKYINNKEKIYKDKAVSVAADLTLYSAIQNSENDDSNIE